MNIFISDYILKNNKLTISFIYVIDPEAELLKEIYTWRMPPKEVLDQHPYYIDNYKSIDAVIDYNYSELNSEYLEEQIRNSPILSEFIRDNAVLGEDTKNINIFDSIESLLSYTKNKKEEIQNDAIEDAISSPTPNEFLNNNLEIDLTSEEITTDINDSAENIELLDLNENNNSITNAQNNELIIEDNIESDNNQAEGLDVEPKLGNQINESETESDLNE